MEIESTKHYFLRCQNKVTSRKTLINEQNSINRLLVTFESDELAKTILYGNEKNYIDSNFKILRATIPFIKSTQQFEEALC